jgi:hypothetical protein
MSAEGFNLKAFGEGLREERIKHGFKSSTRFREAMRQQTGYELSRDTLYKVEQGARDMKVDLLWAWSVTLYGHMDWEKGAGHLLSQGYAGEIAAGEPNKEIACCEDCKYYRHDGKPFRGWSDWCLLHKNIGMIAVTPDGFCAWGEKERQ